MRLAETFHPGVFLEEELEARGWTRADLGNILGRAANDISQIIKGRRGITPDTAIGLGEAFGTGPEYWMNLETAYQLSLAEKKKGQVAERAAIYSDYPVREIIKRGWLKATQDVDELSQQILGFYGKSSLDEPFDFYCASRKATSYTEANNMFQDAWLARARNLAPAVQIFAKYSVARLRVCIGKLKKLMHEPSETRHVPKTLAEAGVRFLIIETLPRTKIDGATFWLGEKKDEPVIVLSLRYDRIDNFWFTLFHELSHVMWGDGKEAPIIDENLMGDIAASDRPEHERRADIEAQTSCVLPAELESFILRNHPYYVEWKIQGFASLQNIHAGIVVGQLQHRYAETAGKRGMPHSHLRKLLVKVRQFITEAALTDGFGYVPSR
jgi:HTH-type transcriptional regulator/antitoxin HigA